MATIFQRFVAAYNTFRDRNESLELSTDVGSPYSLPQHRARFSRGNERSIVSAIYTRAAIDVASMRIAHTKVDENENFTDVVASGLNRCLTVEANVDQTHRAFLQDLVMSMFDEGVVALVPIDTTMDVTSSAVFDIFSMRTAKIVEWYPRHVKVSVYNDRTGRKEDIRLPKANVAIIENPLYAVMNEPNSTLQRLIRKLNLLDAVDEQSSSGKLDLIIQLPYSIRSESMQIKAENRRKDIERQLTGSKYGIAYADGTERITQLNRPSENNLLAQVEYLTRMLYSQLGLSEEIFNGTADAKVMTNYYNRTVEPIISAICDEMTRKFLSKTAYTQGHRIQHFRDVFSLATAAELAELSDKLTRNEVVTGNEFRAILGLKPSDSAGANELRNKNIALPAPPSPQPDPALNPEGDVTNVEAR